ncbi:hypothetical protein SAMN05216268_111271 [Streptomyces yunnanensis]|uniref:Uncharacterized protein n=1 Tax=Streptomyces yunnanensis TaxID=156453 RepID=A0A9X8N0E7_9ACTN|nr:hypothetical protein SAMN05216268_111271 [Streptomyces yunnanensis]
MKAGAATSGSRQPGGKRIDPGFLVQTKGKQEAQKLWGQAQDGVDIGAKETMAEYPDRWHSKRVDLMGKTRTQHRDFISCVLKQALGHLAHQAQRVGWGKWHCEDPDKCEPYVDSGYVFTRTDGHPTLRTSPRPSKGSFSASACHEFTYTTCAASLSLAAGLSMKEIQAPLGYSNYQLTADSCASLLPQSEQAATNAPVGLVPRRNGVEKPTDQQPLPPRQTPPSSPPRSMRARRCSKMRYPHPLRKRQGIGTREWTGPRLRTPLERLSSLALGFGESLSKIAPRGPEISE